MVTKLKIRRDNSTVWKHINPVLEQGEPAVELDTGRMKIGDGEHHYVELPYTSSTSTGGTTTVAWGDIIGTIASNDALATALSNKEDKANKGIANGYAPLNKDAVIPGIHILKGEPNGVPSLDKDGIVLREQLPPNSIPKGVIVMWSGTLDTIPAGWALCDGTNDTPNLQGKFIVGTNPTTPIGSTGGSAQVTLTTEQLPSHSHPTGSHTHTFNGNTGEAIALLTLGAYDAANAGPQKTTVYCNINSLNYTDEPITNTATHSHPFSGTTNSATGNTQAVGSGKAINILPPYYTLAYIIKL